MKNIHVLPTDKPSRLSFIHDKLYFDKEEEHITSSSQNIYITSDEEIKERNYVFNEVSNEVYRITILNELVNYEKKVILTTDSNLIKDGVQEIDDEFLEWFVKNPNCEFVEVKKSWFSDSSSLDGKYKIIIPKEEPKQETLEEAALNYAKQLLLVTTKDGFIAGAKWQQQQNKNLYSILDENYDLNIQFHQAIRESIFSFAVAVYDEKLTFEEWTKKHYGKHIEVSKNLYSEEEVYNLLIELSLIINNIDIESFSIDKWFNQNKKK